MSLATLKRKTKATTEAHISRGPFSINGGFRNLGYIGRTTNGQSHIDIGCSGEDARIIKPSVVGHRVVKADPCIAFKQVSGNRSHSEYLEHVRMSRITTCPDPEVKEPMPWYGKARQFPTRTAPLVATCVHSRIGPSIPDMPHKTGAVSVSERLQTRVACETHNDWFGKATAPGRSCGAVFPRH